MLPSHSALVGPPSRVSMGRKDQRQQQQAVLHAAALTTLQRHCRVSHRLGNRGLLAAKLIALLHTQALSHTSWTCTTQLRLFVLDTYSKDGRSMLFCAGQIEKV